VGATLGAFSIGGNGTLNPPVGPATVLTGEQNSSSIAFSFLSDGQHLEGRDYAIVGRGWLVSGHTNDWIVTAERVPEPSTLFFSVQDYWDLDSSGSD